MLKKIIIAVSMCITSFAFFPVYAEENSDTFLTLSDYNDKFSKEAEDNSEEFLSLSEYNSTYSNGEVNPDTPENYHSSSNWAISSVKQQTKPIVVERGACQVGTITLQYQTDVQGGRPQFLYDRCYLSHPNLTTYWNLEYSTVNFSGDCISVYFSFVYGVMQDHAWVYFYPN